MSDCIAVKESSYSYNQIIEREVRLYLKHILEGKTYHPFKYY